MVKIQIFNAILLTFVVFQVFSSQFSEHGIVRALVVVICFLLGISFLIKRANRGVVVLVDANRKMAPKLFDSQESDKPGFERLGFRHFDTFTTQAKAKLIVYAYVSIERKSILLSYHFPKVKTIDVATEFSNGVGLTTTNSGAFGIRPKKDLMQSFTGASVTELLEKHEQSTNFIESMGCKAQLPDLNGLRKSVTESTMKQHAEQKKVPFYSLVHIYLVPLLVLRYSGKSIEVQHSRKMIAREVFG